MKKEITYCGFVAIVGRPNVGKSTLLNLLLGQKISITSHKPRTTRYNIMGIHTEGPYQVIYVDTPGFCIEEKCVINQLINHTISSSINNVGLIIFVVEGIYWTWNDKIIMNKLCNINRPVILMINKVDKIVDKRQLLRHIHFLSNQMNFYEILPTICTKNSMNIDILSSIVYKTLPEAIHIFPKHYITNCSHHFMASEIIREKLIRFFSDEIPYSVIVNIERFIINDSGNYDIYGLILVKRIGQKKIIVGNKGSKIKIINIKARQDMECIFNRRVHLTLWVKVKSRWADDNESILHKMGCIDFC